MIHLLGSSGSLHVNSPLVISCFKLKKKLTQAQANGNKLFHQFFCKIFQLRNTTLILNLFADSVKNELCEKFEMSAFLKVRTRTLATLSCFTKFRMRYT